MTVLLDTNVVSELIRKAPDSAVEVWAGNHALEDLFFSVVGEAELRYGAAILLAGRRRASLVSDIEAMPRDAFRDRVLPFDSKAARAGHRRHRGTGVDGVNGGSREVRIRPGTSKVSRLGTSGSGKGTVLSKGSTRPPSRSSRTSGCPFVVMKATRQVPPVSTAFVARVVACMKRPHLPSSPPSGTPAAPAASSSTSNTPAPGRRGWWAP